MNKPTVEQMVHARIKRSDLYKSMIACGRYDNNEVVTRILEMREDVRAGQDPEEVLYDEGFEPDFVFDLL